MPAQRLARCESPLIQHGAFDQSKGKCHAQQPPTVPVALQLTPRLPPSSASGDPSSGTRLPNEGMTRSFNINTCNNLEQDVIRSGIDPVHRNDRAGDTARNATTQGSLGLDPLTAAAFGTTTHRAKDLLQYHPSHAEALTLWQIYSECVDPICNILHLPTTGTMVHSICSSPSEASRSEECLLFPLYHFAVFSLSEEECSRRFHQELRDEMLRMFRYATQQALINVQWLQTTSLLVFQALVLFLIPARYAYDPQTYWILAGAASRIGQRMGVFGDGEDLDLRPFDVEMRRRLYMQLVQLDGIAAQMSGADLPIVPASWNSRPSSNRNDNQMWSEMKEAPPDQDVATDMIFCLTRG
ncbi:hypothetical protein H2200_010336 [Cladophialophora chaetospira]|uniref:Xylanolytic transcriptional activator regulatory domain-containing protein n=1 Tax=Cladophialophora chaetospira TaxID=386627 RepID=A0AA38X1A2_9EURO|nr:hypothetical protein H2200_010336 [Cladophialophora chaetospira]